MALASHLALSPLLNQKAISRPASELKKKKNKKKGKKRKKTTMVPELETSVIVQM